MIPSKKYCPSCNHRFLVDPAIRENTCPKCGITYKVIPKLSDTDHARGGFRLESNKDESNFKEELLQFINDNPHTSSYVAAKKLRKSVSTVRTYIRLLESSKLVNVDKSHKLYRYTVNKPRKYYRDNRDELLKKRSEKLKQEKIEAGIPILEKLPGQVMKRCPLCNKRVYLYPEDDPGECLHCGKTFYVAHLLSDSTNKMNIGGVRLWAGK
jgi:predicted nucleic acid-binding Zn ribbon protein